MVLSCSWVKLQVPNTGIPCVVPGRKEGSAMQGQNVFLIAMTNHIITKLML